MRHPKVTLDDVGVLVQLNDIAARCLDAGGQLGDDPRTVRTPHGEDEAVRPIHERHGVTIRRGIHRRHGPIGYRSVSDPQSCGAIQTLLTTSRVTMAAMRPTTFLDPRVSNEVIYGASRTRS